MDRPKCGIPGCKEPTEVGLDICRTHFDDGYQDDYNTYRSYVDEGYPRFKAAIMAGLSDPDE